MMAVLFLAVVFCAPQAVGQIWRVDKSATGANNGTSWQNAYIAIQPAIDAAFVAGGGEVWVAGGPAASPVVYNEARTEVWGAPTTVAGSLVMKDNVQVYGGFEGWRGGAGAQETARSQRQLGINVTVINGATSRAGAAAYHVVVFGKENAATVNARLDGFHITGGNASGVASDYHTWRGGGIYNWLSAPVIANCQIYGNTASVSGGGVANEGRAGFTAAAQYINCIISGNNAIRNIDWQSNPARGGGGVFINLSTPSITHCTITGNSTGAGAALPGMPVNYGLNSGGIFNVTVGALPAAAGTVLSSIVWNNTGTEGIINQAVSGIVKNMSATYSDIAMPSGTYTGTGNINANPNFAGAFPFAYQINGAPCMDTGSSSLTEDLRGVPRPIGAGRDMGAYEYSAIGPVAVCQSHTVILDAGCSGAMTAANIDGGSGAQAGIWKIVASQTTFGSADIPNKSVTLTVYDKIGRTSSCVATVTVNDSIPPVITSCPPNQTVSANASCVAPAPNLAALVTATDNCGIASITQVPAAGTNLPLGPTPIQITVTDVGGNAVLTCAPVVTVVDDTNPVISVCPPSQLVAPDANCQFPMPNFIPSGAYSDNCGIASVTQNPPAGTIVTGTTTVTITVTDTSSNVATCQTTAIANDSTNPVAVCQPVTVNLSAPTINGQAIDGGSTDNCGITTWLINGAATHTFLCTDRPVTIATLTVLDAAGNSASCPATVTVVDDVPPVITLLGLDPVTVECGGVYNDAGASALDNCDGALVVNAVNPVFTGAVGTYIVTYDVMDAAGNPATQVTRTVNVVDTTPPVITLLGANPVTVECSEVYSDDGATASDICDGNLTASINVVNPVNTAVKGTYTVTYDVNDGSSNPAAQVTRTVHVVDTRPPVITLLGSSPIDVECGSVYADDGATAADDCDIDLTLSIITVNPVNTAVLGPYTVTYNVSDGSSNPAPQVTREVNVVDTTDPVITDCGPDQTVSANASCQASVPDFTAGVVATDNCGIASITQNPAAGTSVGTGAHTITLTVTDTSSNFSTCQATLYVNDTTDPVITSCGPNQVVSANAACLGTVPDFTAGVDATDNCGIASITQNPVAGALLGLGPHTITLTVTDTSSNAVTCQTTLTVNDTTPPVITRLGDALVYVQQGDPLWTDPGATAADNCDGDLTAQIITVNPVNVNVPSMYTITYDVSDAALNPAAQVTRTVLVSDTTQPDVVSVVVESELTVLVTYNKSMDGGIGAQDTGNYTVDGSGRGTLNEHPASVARVSATVYRLTWTRPNEMFNGGDIEITVNPDVEDSAGNFMRYNVGEDTGGAIGEAPVITMNAGDETLECSMDVYTEAGASAEDNVDGPVAVAIAGDDLVDTSQPGDYVITYTAVDAAGNEATETRTITVEDTTDPVITMLGDNPLVIECGALYEDDGISAEDLCTEADDLLLDVLSTVDENTLGDYTVTYTVDDGSGNIAIAVRDVSVVDTTAPEIALLGSNPYVLADGGDYVEEGAEATDACEGPLTGINIAGSVPDTTETGVHYLTYTISDGQGNIGEATRIVVIKPEDCGFAFTLDVTPNPVSPGQPVTFTVEEDAGSCSAGVVDYFWLKAPLPPAKSDFEAILDAPNSPVYTIADAGYGDAGIYKCYVQDEALESVDTNEVTLLVDTGVPAAGMAGLMFVAMSAALAGVAALRRRR